jgi:uncharacterized protein (TIGR03435 family)
MCQPDRFLEKYASIGRLFPTTARRIFMRNYRHRILGIRRYAGAALVLAFFSVDAIAQVAPSPNFEVASVKPAAPQSNGQNRLSMRGGPGTSDPGQISYNNVSLMSVLRIAYGAYFYQIDGPSWLGISGYDINAKITPGTTKEQFNQMLMNLLAERFNLKLHHESRDVQGFELVAARNGSKLKESTMTDSSNSDVPQSGPQATKTDASGFPQLDHPGVAMAMKMAPNAKTPSVYMTFRAQTLSGLVRTVGEELGRPVIDKTGLVGKYDFTLQFVPDTGALATQSLAYRSDDSGPGIRTALPEQLGLRLEPKKVPLDMLVIDSADKTPTGN